MKAAAKAIVFRFPFTTGVVIGLATWGLGIAALYPIVEWMP